MTGKVTMTSQRPKMTSARRHQMKMMTTPPQQRGKNLFVVVFSLLCVYLVYQMTNSSPDWFGCPNEAFVLTLSKHATSDRFIVLALVDTAFVDMAINLYESSLKPNKIDNFLFVGAGLKACEMLRNVSLPCYHYTEDKATDVASIYKSVDFNRKMNIRTDMILDALSVGFTVLHTDLDVMFLKNPLPDLKVVMLKADIATMWDSVAYNAGFVVVRPTWFSKKVYERMKSITGYSPKTDDQMALNSAIQRMNRVYRRNGFSAVALDSSRYLCGVDYFEKGNRMFPDHNNCTDCAVVHNNWIVSRDAKIYRFREHRMWMYDKEEYYSSNENSYLTYRNPIVWTTEFASVAEELEALKAALAIGQILNRIVILPRFHCSDSRLSDTAIVPISSTSHPSSTSAAAGTKPGHTSVGTRDTRDPHPKRDCPLNGLLNITAFDAIFAGRYRESSFLSHPLVGEEVRQDRSPEHIIVTGANIDLRPTLLTLGGKSSNRVRNFDRRKSGSSATTSTSTDEVLEIIPTSVTQSEQTTDSIIMPRSIADAELRSWFNRYRRKNSDFVSDIPIVAQTPRILVFRALYRAVPTFSNLEQQTIFEENIRRAFHKGSYRQGP